MPSLLELQRAVHRSLIGCDDGALAHIIGDGLAPEARLEIYRNTRIGVLTKALRLSYPAVYRIVGGEFFESAAGNFIAAYPPQSADLDAYGAAFPAFLGGFPPAATLAYLPDVARLEWAVSQALRAADGEALELHRLASLEPADRKRVALRPHPSIGLVHAAYPADTIWRAVLSCDDLQMAAIDLGSGPVWLLVRRRETGLEVVRLSPSEWRFAAELCASRPLQAAIAAAPEIDAVALLADYLIAGCFIDFVLVEAVPIEGVV